MYKRKATRTDKKGTFENVKKEKFKKAFHK